MCKCLLPDPGQGHTNKKCSIKLLASDHRSQPARVDHSSKLEPRDAPVSTTPRTSSSFSRPLKSRFPPPPSVEDEESAVAKELNGSVVNSGDEEPKHRGTVDQLPILLSLLERDSKTVPQHEHDHEHEHEHNAVPESETQADSGCQADTVVHEYKLNKERRFILVSDDEVLSDGSDAQKPRAATLNTTVPHTANNNSNKRHLDPKAAAVNSNDAKEQPELQRRKSRADLPRLETSGAVPLRRREADPVSSHLHRSQSATCVDHIPPPRKDPGGSNGTGDYFSIHPESARPARHNDGDFLAPNVIKHSTKGRDRAYWDINAAGLGKSSPRASSPNRESARPRQVDGTVPSAGSQRRFHSDMEVPQIKKSSERHSSYRHRDDSESSRTGTHRPSSPKPDRRPSPSGPRLARRESSPVRPARGSCRNTQVNIGGPRCSHASLSSAHKEREQQRDSSSDDLRENAHHHAGHHRERRKSMVIQEHRTSLLSPAGPRPPPSPRSKSRPPSPLPSPEATTTSQTRFPDLHSALQQSISSLQTPRDQRRTGIERPISPLSSCSGSLDLGEGANGRPRASSRAPSIRSNVSTPVGGQLSRILARRN